MGPREEVEIRLFGAFREVSPDGVIAIAVRGDETAGEIKTLLTQAIATRPGVKPGLAKLIERSVLATDERVLSDTEPAIFQSAGQLSVLPPVSGG